MSKANGKFWVVWNPAGRQPRMQHAFKDNAETEASRLARENPDQPFYVLEAITCWYKTDVISVDLATGETHREAPF